MFPPEPKEIDLEKSVQIFHWYSSQPHGRPRCLLAEDYRERLIHAMDSVFREIKMSDFVNMKIGGQFGQDVCKEERDETLKILEAVP